jgi:hypothetical protein
MQIRVVKVFHTDNSWTEFRGIRECCVGQYGELYIFHYEGTLCAVFSREQWMNYKFETKVE